MWLAPETIEGGLRLIEFLAGIVIVLYTMRSVIITFVMPRGDNSLLTAGVLQFTWLILFRWRLLYIRSYLRRDRLLAFVVPTALLLLPVAWVTLVIIGYALMYYALGVRPLYDALLLSGSSLLTLGYYPVDGWAQMILSFSEATIGLGLIALLIAYLPTLYTGFSQRERMVALIESRAGSPPWAVDFLVRAHRIRNLANLRPFWREAEDWFSNLEESHTIFALLAFFRSTQPDRSWITAAGTILDAAAFRAAVVDLPREPAAELCIRTGYIALRRIADFYNITYNPNPQPTDPISIAREEFDAAYARLQADGVPVKADRDEAWRNWAGWRVNYDVVLLELANLILAPYAPWSSDRSLRNNPSHFDHIRAQ